MNRLICAVAVCFGCATIPRGSTVCVDMSGSTSNPTIDPALPLNSPQSGQLSTCDDYHQAVALAQKIAHDAGVDWRTLVSVRVRSVSSWENVPGVAASGVAGTEFEGVVNVDRCLASLLHEDLHWVETGVTGLIPPDEWLNQHGEWLVNGYWALECFFEWYWSHQRVTNTDCHIYRMVLPNGKLLDTSMPPAMESKLRTAGWGPKLDEWRAELGTSKRAP